jgi:hypothetical protein
MFNQTFMTTWRSFIDADALFNLLVRQFYIDGPPGRLGSGCVYFIALTAVLRHEFHHTPFHTKDAQSIENYGGQNQATPPS